MKWVEVPHTPEKIGLGEQNTLVQLLLLHKVHTAVAGILTMVGQDKQVAAAILGDTYCKAIADTRSGRDLVQASPAV